MIDIARRTGFSVSTVSRVVNNFPYVKPETRRIIEEAMRELAYLPNASAQGLATSRTGTIGFVVSNLGNPGLQMVSDGVAGVVQENGYSLLLCDSQGEERIQSASLRRLFERRVEGLIVSAIGEPREELEYFVRARIPAVELYFGGPRLGVPRLVVDLSAGMRAGLEYLASLGHRRIALVTHVRQHYRERIDDFRENMLRLGLAYDPSLVLLIENLDECPARVTGLVTREDRPTAVFSAVSTVAPYALAGIHHARLKVPADISFLTMDDSPWLLALEHPVTAVTTDYREVGRLATHYIFAHLTGIDGTAYLERVTPQVLIRQSCARCATP